MPGHLSTCPFIDAIGAEMEQDKWGKSCIWWWLCLFNAWFHIYGFVLHVMIDLCLLCQPCCHVRLMLGFMVWDAWYVRCMSRVLGWWCHVDYLDVCLRVCDTLGLGRFGFLTPSQDRIQTLNPYLWYKITWSFLIRVIYSWFLDHIARWWLWHFSLVSTIATPLGIVSLIPICLVS